MMIKRILTVSLCLLALTLCSFAQTKKVADEESCRARSRQSLHAEDLGRLVDARSCQCGPVLCHRSARLLRHRAAEVRQLGRIREGRERVLAGYKSAKFTVNDDAEIHPHGDLVWGTATIKEEMTTKAGKVEMGNFRWTVIWENEDGKWVIVHEHVSQPIQ